MNNPLDILMNQHALDEGLFPTNSRYHGIPVRRMTTEAGDVVFLRRRFIPGTEQFSLIQEHVVKQGDRLDHLAHLYFDDPEQFWRLCDANGAMRPDELIEALGRKLRITLPEGVAGAGDD